MKTIVEIDFKNKSISFVGDPDSFLKKRIKEMNQELNAVLPVFDWSKVFEYTADTFGMKVDVSNIEHSFRGQVLFSTFLDVFFSECNRQGIRIVRDMKGAK